MTSTQLIEREDRADGIRVLRLCDAQRHNALSRAMCEQLVEGVAELAIDEAARALVVVGAGPSFCSGADLVDILDAPNHPVDEYRRRLRRVYDAFLGIRDLAIPTIAAVNGHAIGAGLNLALSCDIRFAGTTSRFGATFTRMDLHPGGGCSYFLTAALGAQRALAILLRGATLSAQDSVDLGLTLELHDDPFEAALELAAKIAALPRGLAEDIKTTVRLAATDGFEAAIAHETWAQAAAATRPGLWQVLESRRR